MNNQATQLFTTNRLNPVLTRENWSYPINHVSNAGATVLTDGTTLLLCHVEEHRGGSHFCAARSANGMDTWCIDPQPTLLPDRVTYPDKLRGIEAPRITYAPELAMYIIVFTAYTREGPGVALAVTEDIGASMSLLEPHKMGSCGTPKKSTSYLLQ